MPRRIQLRRTKGWRKPEGAVVVARPTKWGNPVPLDGSWITWTAVALGYRGNREGRRAAAVALHRAWLTGEPVAPGPLAGGTAGGSLVFGDGISVTMDDHVRGIAAHAALASEPPAVPPSPLADIDELAGKDLACWCPEGASCHADVLLKLANPEETSRG